MSAKKRFLEWMGENKPIFDGTYGDGESYFSCYYYETPSKLLEELAKEMSDDE